MKKIETKTARALIANFETAMKKAGIDSPEKGFTECVVFNRKELADWLNTLGSNSELIRIYFAAYPSNEATASLQDKNENRFTTVLWPYNKDGEPAANKDGELESPANYGEVEP